MIQTKARYRKTRQRCVRLRKVESQRRTSSGAAVRVRGADGSIKPGASAPGSTRKMNQARGAGGSRMISINVKRDRDRRPLAEKPERAQVSISKPAVLTRESSRWSESAETTGPDDETNRTPKGCQIYAMNIPRLKIGFVGNGDQTFPVVSADSDHRLLSLQPFGLRLGQSTILMPLASLG
jgi:hypothetical protein